MSNLPTGSFSGDNLLRDLRALGVREGDALECTARCARWGWVVGGAETVVDALMQAIGSDGALVMPAFPLSKPRPLSDQDRQRGVTGKVQRYPEDWRGPTGMGAIADAFRQRPRVELGHGLHRVCAWGREADQHQHGLTHLLQTGGKALLLGVGIYRCTSMHYAEHVGIPAEVSACYEVPRSVSALYPADVLVFGGDTPEPGWSKVLAEADGRGLVAHGVVGAAECMLFVARDVVGIYEQALRDDPYGLFGVMRPKA